jgi:chemotaxis response regulator CheB
MRIGIANGLPQAVQALQQALAARPQHQIVWVVPDGVHAIAACSTDRPDLVLMEVAEPGVNGVEATKTIMAETPCAILIVTQSVGANTGAVFDAMGHGAIDATDTPPLRGAKTDAWVVSEVAASQAAGTAAFLHKIDTLAKLLGTRRRAPTADSLGDTWMVGARERLVAIGASAGGPTALTHLLAGLPRDFPAAVVIVQHVDARFAEGMAEWLTRTSPLPVRIVKEGERPAPGTIWLAGTNDHLVFKSHDRLGYTAEPREHAYRPSVDVFFESVSTQWPGEVVGVLLTGMGRDGANGLKKLRNKGCYTIAQDQATSAVYGMPKAAATLGAAVDILPLDRIAARLVDTFSH